MFTAMEDMTVTSGFTIYRLGSKFCTGNCLKVLLRVFILSNLFNVVWGCGSNEIGWRDGATGEISCGQCTSCPAGMEPTVGCGTTVDKGTVLECKECVAGKTYSDSDSVGLCQACTVCLSTVAVLKQCTADSNTKCGSCPKGHYKDDFIEDCFECSWCCEGDKDYVPECAEQGLPSKQRCKYLGHDCGPTTRYLSNTTADVSNTTTDTRGVTGVILPVDNQMMAGKVPREEANPKPGPEGLSQVLLFLAVLLILIMIVGAVVFYLLRSRGRGRCPGWRNPTQVSKDNHDVTASSLQPQQATDNNSSTCVVIGIGSDIKKQDSRMLEETRL